VPGDGVHRVGADGAPGAYRARCGAARPTEGDDEVDDVSQIFLSYAREDRAFAETVAAWLEVQGWSVWWDRRLLPGSEFDDEIAAALDAASVVVVLWSEASVRSNWVRAEAASAADRGVLVPAALAVGVNLPLEFRRLHTVALHDWQGAGQHAEAQSLVHAIERLAGPPRPAASRTPTGALGGTSSGWRRRARRALLVCASLACLPLLRWGWTGTVVERMSVVGAIEEQTHSVVAHAAGTASLRPVAWQSVAAGDELATIMAADGASTPVVAPAAGEVVWACCGSAAPVDAGDELFRIRIGRPYATLMVGRDLRPGQPVEVFPLGVNRALHGGIIGTVRYVSVDPVDPRSLGAVFGEAVVEAARLRGHAWLAQVDLARDSTTISGYAWTLREPGGSNPAAAGVAVEADVFLMQSTPISVMLGMLGW
jgi:hypothetical protein